MLKHGMLFALGGIAYLIVELLWRGRSHWSMFFLGGACFIAVGMINELSKNKIPILLQGIIGTLLITAMEFLTGYLVNIILDMNVWSYKGLPFNIMGQICLPYMGLWYVLSIVCVIADDYLREYLFGETHVKYKWK